MFVSFALPFPIFALIHWPGSLGDKNKYLTSSVAIDTNQLIYHTGSREVLANGLLSANCQLGAPLAKGLLGRALAEVLANGLSGG